MKRVVKLTCFLLVVFIALFVTWFSSLDSAPHPTARATVKVAPKFLAKAKPTIAASTLSPLPVRLIIPAIGLNASIEPVGVQPNGDLQTAQLQPWDDVGWYKSGAIPGQRGTAVIDGHLDRPGGSAAVFWNLRDLHAGDAVMVINAQGKTIRFHVTQILSYPPQQAPLQQIFGNGGGTFLNLITCAGDWIPNQHQTTLREVVYTTLW